jgi:uncharacterized membrane protein
VTPGRRSRRTRNVVPRESPRALPLAALVVGLLGAAAIMISPITSWTTVLAVGGIVLLVPSAAVLAVGILRNW